MPKQPDYKELYNLLYRSTNAAMQTLEESISRCRKAYLAACGPRGTGQSQAERERLRPHFTQLMKLICKEYDVTPAELFAGGGQPVALADTEQELLRRWALLPAPQRGALLALMDRMIGPGNAW